MSFRSGDKVIAKNLVDGSWVPAEVISVNGPNIWVRLDSGSQVIRWDHEIKPRKDDEHV